MIFKNFEREWQTSDSFLFMRLPCANKMNAKKMKKIKFKHSFAYSNFSHAQQIVGICNCMHAALTCSCTELNVFRPTNANQMNQRAKGTEAMQLLGSVLIDVRNIFCTCISDFWQTSTIIFQPIPTNWWH